MQEKKMSSAAKNDLQKLSSSASLVSADGQKGRFNMAGAGQKPIANKRGIPVYRTNPSVPDPETIRRRKPLRYGDEKRGFVVDGGNGEIIGVGGMNFYEFEEVDPTKFVKLFLAGIKQAVGLSKTGMLIFQMVYQQMQQHPGSDEIKLNPVLAQDANIPERTFRRGVRELLEKEFIFRSPSDGVFFVNIKFMFNGDRLAFVKGYKLKNTSTQAELPLETPALSGPSED
jgi:hypothetical protein